MLRLAVLCVLVVASWAGERCYPMGLAGDKCTPDGRYCPAEEGVCVEGTCKCVSHWGQPEMLCAHTEDYFASVLNDPKAWTINNREEADLPVPCQYLFSHVTTSTVGPLSPDGQCDVRVNLNNQRVKGKTFVGGFEISVDCTDIFPMIAPGGKQNHVYKVDARVNDKGEYCFDLQASFDGGNTFSDDLQMGDYTKRIDAAPYTFEVDPTTNRVKLQIPAAGVSAQLRPVNPALSVFDQEWLPGFAVKYDKDNDVKFRSDNEVISLPPKVTISQVAGDNRAATDELIYRAFTGAGNTEADFPNFSDKCLAVKENLLQCPNNAITTETLAKCRFILSRPKVVSCLSPWNSGNVKSVLELYGSCVEAFCQQKVVKCNELVQLLQNLPCKEDIPDDMLEHRCMFNVR